MHPRRKRPATRADSEDDDDTQSACGEPSSNILGMDIPPDVLLAMLQSPDFQSFFEVSHLQK